MAMICTLWSIKHKLITRLEHQDLDFQQNKMKIKKPKILRMQKTAGGIHLRRKTET